MKKLVLPLLLIFIQGFAEDCFFIPPKNWQAIAEKKLPQNVTQMAKGYGKKELPPSINLSIEKTSLNIEQYTKAIKAVHLSNRLNSWVKLGNIDTAAGEAVLTQIRSKCEWGAIRMLQCFMVKNGHAYVITTTALEEEFPKFYREFFSSIQSLQFTSSGISQKDS